MKRKDWSNASKKLNDFKYAFDSGAEFALDELQKWANVEKNRCPGSITGNRYLNKLLNKINSMRENK